MSFLMHFFADDTELARRLAADKPLLLQSMQRYFDSFKAKTEARYKLLQGVSMAQLLPIYKQALADELADVESMESKENHIIDHLTTLEKHFHDFANLERTMDYALSREHYVYNLMVSIHHTLRDQAHIVKLLEKDVTNDKLQRSFIGMLELEQQMLSGLGNVTELLRFYQELAQGARIKHELSEREREAADDIYEYMMRYEIAQTGSLRPLERHHITKLTVECFNRLVLEVMDAVQRGVALQHTHVLFEYVNSDLFVEYVKKQIMVHKLLDMNDREKIKIFIHIFRDLYNTRIEAGMY
jgi:hypothetical protein